MRLGNLSFQSTPSTRRETLIFYGTVTGYSISIHSLHTEGDRTPICIEKIQVQISIHSLHTEGDRKSVRRADGSQDFNPLPPHGGRLVTFPSPTWEESFQSTPSTRRETLRSWVTCLGCTNFNPLPPHGGRPLSESLVMQDRVFQSTPSTRRETPFLSFLSVFLYISIHSLHTEGDRIPQA